MLLTDTENLNTIISLDIEEYYYNLQTDITKLTYSDNINNLPNSYIDMLELTGTTNDETLYLLDSILMQDAPNTLRGTNIPLPIGKLTASKVALFLHQKPYERTYASPILRDWENDTGEQFQVDQHIYIKTTTNKKLSIQFNPKRFAGSDYFTHEPLIEFVVSYLLPNMINTVITRLDINTDLIARPQGMKLYENSKLIPSVYGTQYMHIKRQGLQLKRYDKVEERNEHSTTESYFHLEETNQVNEWNKGKGITRLELSITNTTQLKAILKHAGTKKRVIPKEFDVKYKYTENGKRKEKSWKEILNRCYDNIPKMLKDFPLVTNEIYLGTKYYHQKNELNPYK